MLRTSPPAIAFVGSSDSGKTTLITKLIAIYSRQGLQIGAIKHHRHEFDIDREGKDSWRLARAGAASTVITSPTQTALIRKTARQLAPEEIIAAYGDDLDLVLVEGFKESRLPKIEVHRLARRPDLICRGSRNDPDLIAVASDRQWELDVPVFSLDDSKKLAAFILDFCRRR
ncbi:MAG: molybdopterin-guanine dinucleotide biosynthesis protein B [Deltaproteobacteria bacterium]|nr:molybdopterin-guanine dinucleotide biosynthesis protein B [Deltaproteobacteria bacterium]